MIAVTRLFLPDVNIAATTALQALHPLGRELGLKAGANVLMPNISPLEMRKNYLLYDNKIGTADDASESLDLITAKIKSIGYEVSVDRGDYR